MDFHALSVLHESLKDTRKQGCGVCRTPVFGLLLVVSSSTDNNSRHGLGGGYEFFIVTVYFRNFTFFSASSNASMVAGLIIITFAPSFMTFLRVSGWSSDVITNTGTGIKRGSRRR